MSLPFFVSGQNWDSPSFEAALFPSQLLICSPNNITRFFLILISTPHSSLFDSFPTFKSSIIYIYIFFKLQASESTTHCIHNHRLLHFLQFDAIRCISEIKTLISIT